MAEETAAAPAETPTEETKPVEQVRDAQAVLKQNEELLSELKRIKPLAKQAEGFDFEKAKAALEAQEKAELERLTKKGEWDKLKEQLDLRHTEDLKKAQAQTDEIRSVLHKEKLTNKLIEKGVLPDRAKYLVNDLLSQTELVIEDNKFDVKKIGGIGDAVEFDAMIESAKQASPFFFAANGASGSGAHGSNGNGGGSAKSVTRAQWDNADAAQRTAWGLDVAVRD